MAEPYCGWHACGTRRPACIEMEEQLSGDIVRSLIKGVADVGVFADNAPACGLSTTPFQTDELVVLCARTHALVRH